MRRLIAIAIAAALALNGVATIIGRGSFVHTLVAVGLAAYVGLPAFMAGAVFFALRARYRRGRPVAVAAWSVSAVSLSLLLSLWLGAALARRDIAEAKAYCERLADRLDRQKASAGRYPAALGSVADGRDRPRLLRESLSYTSDGAQFELTFTDPRAMMSGLTYRSTDRRWTEWD